MATPTEIWLLGSLEVHRDGCEIHGFESRKSRAILGYVIAECAPVSRESLADMFWSGKGEARGRRNLSHELSLLSDLLPGCLTGDHDSVCYAGEEDCWVDTVTFERLTTPWPANSRLSAYEMDDRVAALMQAAELPRGDFMAGLHVDDSPDFEMWLTRQQERWRQRIASLFECLVVYLGRLPDNARAQVLVRRWLSLEPWREEAHQHLMRLLALSGQRSAALAQFQLLRQILAEELDAPPAAASVKLYEDIRAGTLG